MEWDWGLLVHVCRRWRQVVFASPRRLDLRILCTTRTPARKNLGIWPSFPITISDFHCGNSNEDEDNLIAALEHSDRVSEVALEVAGSQLGTFTMVMHKPFPVLTSLYIASEDANTPVLPAEFLGGSAPCLQCIYLDGIPYPSLPTLLLFANDLVSLRLRNIPQTGYVTPEALAVGLAAVPRLNELNLEFQSATPRPDSIPPHRLTRIVLTFLANFTFEGASEYLEDLVSRIDAPQLKDFFVYYLNQLVDFRVIELPKFINRSVGAKLTHGRYARVTFDSGRVTFHTSHFSNDPSAAITIFCKGIDWQVSHVAQVLSEFSVTLSNVGHLKLEDQLEDDHQIDGTEDVEWLHLLHRFATAQSLYVSRKLAAHVALALEQVTWETVAGVLPSLEMIYLAGQPESSIEKFIAACTTSGLSVTVVSSENEYLEKIESYVSK